MLFAIKFYTMNKHLSDSFYGIWSQEVSIEEVKVVFLMNWL
jgi:hypothetical protein